MKEVNFFDHHWYKTFEWLRRGQSVMLFASEYYGKQTFLQSIRNDTSLSQTYRVINVGSLKDDVSINYQAVLDSFQGHLPPAKRMLAGNHHEFVNVLDILVQDNSFLVLISNTVRSYRNVSQLVDAFHEIIQKYPNGHRRYLTVLLMDDYSLYYNELQRAMTDDSSPWFFFNKVYVRHLSDTTLLEPVLRNFFHNRQLAEALAKTLMDYTGGHQGMLGDTVDHLMAHWEAIDFDKVTQELHNYLAERPVMGSFIKELSQLSVEDVAYMYSFRTRKLIESHCNELVRKWHIKGILVKKGEAYLELCGGMIRELVKNVYNSKVMGNKKKLILCIHGLNGSEETWSAFKKLYENDSELKEVYDFDTYTFPTTMRWELNFLKAANPPIAQLAAGLRTEIEVRFSHYGEVSLVCHSLGGLVGRKMLLEHYLLQKHDVKVDEGFPKMEKIIMYATPNNGSGLANAARYVTIRNRQVRQLCRKAEFLQELNEKWMQLGAHDHYKGWYVIGGKDQVVSPDSVSMYWGNTRCKTIIGADHFDIIKPSDAKSLSYLLFRKILLEEN